MYLSKFFRSHQAVQDLGRVTTKGIWSNIKRLEAAVDKIPTKQIRLIESKEIGGVHGMLAKIGLVDQKLRELTNQLPLEQIKFFMSKEVGGLYGILKKIEGIDKKLTSLANNEQLQYLTDLNNGIGGVDGIIRRIQKVNDRLNSSIRHAKHEAAMNGYVDFAVRSKNSFKEITEASPNYIEYEIAAADLNDSNQWPYEVAIALWIINELNGDAHNWIVKAPTFTPGKSVNDGDIGDLDVSADDATGGKMLVTALFDTGATKTYQAGDSLWYDITGKYAGFDVTTLRILFTIT